MRQERTKRPGFTLLEVILAVSLSVVLLSALYVALSMHYNQTRMGREVLEETVIVRAVVNRIAQDIACELPPIDPRIVSGATTAPSSSGSGSGSGSGGGGGSGGGSSSSKSGSGGGSSGNSSNSGNTGSMSGGSSMGGNSGSNSSGSSSSSSAGSGITVTSNLQVYGDNSNLVLSGRTVPQDLSLPPQTLPTMTSDLRRISYWVVPGRGLARYEEAQVTGGDALTTPPSLPPVADVTSALIVAPEVTSITFEYFDGSSWQQSWDGGTMVPINSPLTSSSGANSSGSSSSQSSSGQSSSSQASSGSWSTSPLTGQAAATSTTRPMGPPAAIAFTVTLNVPVQQGPQKTRTVTYRHVVPLHTANNFAAAGPSTTGSTTPTPSSTSGQP